MLGRHSLRQHLSGLSDNEMIAGNDTLCAFSSTPNKKKTKNTAFPAFLYAIFSNFPTIQYRKSVAAHNLL
jgi:hypothetical protein